ncbi:hypothetical protein DdX_20419 [Ditylenchus destructor]|uniref:Uncharacterized protein n=1 Tax=Ditylenchus destructor TaxID=166010 RepID=A0AAD4MH95_9BILA|nr:hypothetical protein DdX_20419 [Ditylenchus destructor]
MSCVKLFSILIFSVYFADSTDGKVIKLLQSDRFDQHVDVSQWKASITGREIWTKIKNEHVRLDEFDTLHVVQEVNNKDKKDRVVRIDQDSTVVFQTKDIVELNVNSSILRETQTIPIFVSDKHNLDVNVANWPTPISGEQIWEKLRALKEKGVVRDGKKYAVTLPLDNALYVVQKGNNLEGTIGGVAVEPSSQVMFITDDIEKLHLNSKNLGTKSS